MIFFRTKFGRLKRLNKRLIKENLELERKLDEANKELWKAKTRLKENSKVYDALIKEREERKMVSLEEALQLTDQVVTRDFAIMLIGLIAGTECFSWNEEYFESIVEQIICRFKEKVKEKREELCQRQ